MRTDRERNEVTLKFSQKVLDDLTKGVDESTTKLAELVSDYDGLAPSGSFSAQVEKAITLVEQKVKSIQESGVDKAQLDKLEASLAEMRKKLDVLREASTKAKKEATGVFGQI